MARRANFINDYGKAKPEQRVRMIFLNYHAFPDIILGYEQKIISINGQVGKVFFIEEYPKSLESDIIAALTKVNCTSYISVNNELLDISGFKWREW